MRRDELTLRQIRLILGKTGQLYYHQSYPDMIKISLFCRKFSLFGMLSMPICVKNQKRLTMRRDKLTLRRSRLILGKTVLLNYHQSKPDLPQYQLVLPKIEPICHVKYAFLTQKSKEAKYEQRRAYFEAKQAYFGQNRPAILSLKLS